MNLVLIETSGNQRYIFTTNKLRENVGASELTFRAGAEFTLDAVATVAGRASLYDEDDSKLRANLLDATKNPPLEKNPSNKVEIITATSGKALLLVDGEQTAKQIIQRVTTQALREAPGLTVHGAISGKLKDDLSDISDAVKQAHEKLGRNRYRTPSQEQRFLRLPFVEPCATSGLPAREHTTISNESGGYSAVTLAKCNHARSGWQRIERITKRVAPNVRLLKGVDALAKSFKGLGWLGVIHADGNGLGEIFRNFKRYAECDGREYVDKYRRFSLALDICTVNAFGHALEKLRKRFDQGDMDKKKQREGELPIVPIVLGGDDLTVICDGQYAVRFTRDLLTQFEKVDEERNGGIIHEIAQKAFGVGRLGMCAGIAIVKPHFPFHAAYDLAEALLKSAKQVKAKVDYRHEGEGRPLPCSALDYHILYDSSGADLERIREKLKVNDGRATHLYARPYIVTPATWLTNAENQSWIGRRAWMQLEERVNAMRKEEGNEGRRMLPNSLLHDLRENLFLGLQEADARMKLVRRRYEEQGFNNLVVKKNGADSLFWEPAQGETICETNFLDALDVVEFWK